MIIRISSGNVVVSTMEIAVTPICLMLSRRTKRHRLDTTEKGWLDQIVLPMSSIRSFMSLLKDVARRMQKSMKRSLGGCRHDKNISTLNRMLDNSSGWVDLTALPGSK